MKLTSPALEPFSNIAVVGGTPFDSGKGALYLKARGVNCQPVGISEKPSVQSELYKNPGLVAQRLEEKVQGREFSDIIIYCNSLSFIANWPELYPGRIFELANYYQSILSNASIEDLAIIVAEPNSVENLKILVDKSNICNPADLNIFPSLDLINTIEQSDEEAQYKILKNTLNDYQAAGYREILLGCTHLDHPDFNRVEDLKIYQPGLIMLEEFIDAYHKFTSRV